IGSTAGALLRYWLSGVTQRIFNGGFPWGTLSVNLVGSLAIGFLWGMFESIVVSQNMRVMIFIGLLGSFTTFSTFSLESFQLIRDGEYNLFLMNAIASFFLGITLVFSGYFLSQYLFYLIRR
ncbi:MAG: fluoride efflux transporter CrcB, partial [Candidatus Omnitrophica bacterium]|nr:fluoride efflux transporter CrcB [Candidatus Omnitrophota bacterium]